MIIQVCGRTRRGKTSFVCAKTLEEDFKYVNERYLNACKYIKNQNKKHGKNLSLPPQHHVVSANFDLTRKYPNMKSYDISGFEFGVPNKYMHTKPFIPYGVYIFDEAQKYWDSKDEKRLPPWVTQAFEWSGQIFLKIYLITQRYIRLHSDIRGIVDEFYYIDESIHKFKVNGKIVKSKKFIKGELLETTWYGRKFDNEGDLEAYIKGDKTVGEKFKYKFQGDIRKHYNPYNYATNMENLDNDYEYLDFPTTADERPEAWDNYKKELEREKKEREKKEKENKKEAA